MTGTAQPCQPPAKLLPRLRDQGAAGAQEDTARFFSQELLNAALAKQHVELGRVNATEVGGVTDKQNELEDCCSG